MASPAGTPLHGTAEGEHCPGAPHFYIVRGDVAGDDFEVVPYSVQHCCMDHGQGACYGWVCIHIDALGGLKEPTCQLSEAEGESLPLTP